MGLGNLFRFPSLCAGYGIVFPCAYALLLFVLGLPLLCFELEVGRRFGSSPSDALAKLSPIGRLTGRLCALASFTVLCCYGLLFAFVLAAAVFSLQGFFAPRQAPALFETLSHPSGITPTAVFFLLLGWVLTLLCFGDARRLGKISTVGMAVTLTLLLILAAVTLVFGHKGFADLCRFELSPVFTLRFWADAAGQVFFSLSLSVGVMITYGAYLDRRESIPLCALFVALIDMAVSLIATVIYFSVSAEEGGDILSCFTVFPAAFSVFGRWGSLISCGFFLCLSFLCLDSVVAYLKAAAEGLTERVVASNRTRATVFGAVAAFCGMLLLHFGALPFFDGRVTPVLILTAALPEASVLASALKKGRLRGVQNTFTLPFLRFLLGGFIPALLLFLIFGEIFY